MSNETTVSSCTKCGAGLFFGEYCESCRPKQDLDVPGLYTLGQAAKKLKVSADWVRSYVRRGGRVIRDGARVRVRLEDVRPWLAQRAEEQRKADECWARIDKMMFLDKLDLGLEHSASIYRCEHCGEPRLDATVAEQLGVDDAHVCRSASADTATDVPIDEVFQEASG